MNSPFVYDYLDGSCQASNFFIQFFNSFLQFADSVTVGTARSTYQQDWLKTVFKTEVKDSTFNQNLILNQIVFDVQIRTHSNPHG